MQPLRQPMNGTEGIRGLRRVLATVVGAVNIQVAVIAARESQALIHGFSYPESQTPATDGTEAGAMVDSWNIHQPSRTRKPS